MRGFFRMLRIMAKNKFYVREAWHGVKLTYKREGIAGLLRLLD